MKARRLTIVLLAFGGLPGLVPMVRAETWPVAGHSLVLGPESSVHAAALGLWTNPALLPGHGWSAGIAWLEPYRVTAFTRTDASLTAGGERAAAGIGWSALGDGEWGAQALALAGALDAAPERLRVGASLRRSARGSARAWSADLGISCRPAREWRVGVSTKSLWRSRGGPAPEPEWEAALVWSPEPLALGLSVLRDAVGPIENRLGARLAMGPLHTYLAYSDRLGDESRITLGVALSALGFRLAAAQETGGALPDTKAGFLERAPGGGRREARVMASAGLTVGQTAGVPAGFGARGGLRLARHSADHGAELSVAASRDPGEPGGLDERRAALRIWSRRRAEVLLGSFDLRAGRGLVLSGARSESAENERALVAAEPAADWRRPPLPALTGVAARWGDALRLSAAWGRAARDARPVAEGLWPSGGRLHRTDLERERRGSLGEELWAVAAERRLRGARFAVGAVAARYRSDALSGPAPRLAPGGGRVGRARWIYGAFESASARTRHAVELACDGSGLTAFSFWLRAATAAEQPRARIDLLVERKPAGFVAAVAWPAIARLQQLAGRAEFLPFGPVWSLAATRRIEEIWQPPTATLPSRAAWTDERRLILRRNGRVGTAAVEAGRADTRRAAAPLGDASGLWRSVRHSWLEALWRFRAAPDLVFSVAPAWRHTAGAWRERWSLGLAARGVVAWEIEAAIRPGGSVEEELDRLEGNPLGGYRLVASTSPTRFRLRAARGAIAGELRWAESAGRPRPEVWLTWSASTAEGSPR